MVHPCRSTDSERMKKALLVIGLWAALIVGFVLTAERIPWHVSLPAIGFVWAGGPTTIATRQRVPVAFVSVAVYGAVTTGFLTLMWFVLTLAGGIGHVLFELDPDYEGAAHSLAWTGMAGLGGAVAGASAGWWFARRRSSGTSPQSVAAEGA